MSFPGSTYDFAKEEISHCNKSDESLDESDEGDNDSVKRKYRLPMSQKTADHLYDTAGTEEEEINNEIVIHPSLQFLPTSDEMLIMDSKAELHIPFELDNFQVQDVGWMAKMSVYLPLLVLENTQYFTWGYMLCVRS